LGVRCVSCQSDNGDGATFCTQCGARLRIICTPCGESLATNARFCSACGTATVAAPVPAPQRRLLTVVFSDLVDSTRLAERLDPEDLRDLLGAFHRACETAIAEAGGHLAQFLGDGVLAYFGYPRARERDAQAAVRGGLAVVRAVQRIAHRESLQVRVGIHTGLVVTGEVGTGEQKAELAIGSTVHLAARLQSIAAPNRVVVSDATRRITRNVFSFESLGVRELKGIREPVESFEVSGEMADTPAGEAESPGRYAPMIGRDRECEVTSELLASVSEGTGRALLLCGPAGIGKSRMLHDVQARATEAGLDTLECRCSPHRENSALHPAIELIQRAWQIGPHVPPATREARLRDAAQASGVGDDALPLLASLLSIPLSATPIDDESSAERRRERTLQVIVDLLVSLSQEAPVLLAVEDLHWIDPSSLELLDRLIARVEKERILLVVSFRPTWKPPWDPAEHITRIDLERLSERDAHRLIESLTGGRALPAEATRAIDERADGIPLYVEELTRALLDSGQLEERAGTLALRSAGQTLAMQLCAVVGRRFSYALLRELTIGDPIDLARELAPLLDADMLRVDGRPPEATYSFKHALIQDAAYDAMLKEPRSTAHRRVAETLESRFPEEAATQPEVVGRHWAEAGEARRAIAYLQRAGRWAIERSANAEAVQHLSEALRLALTLPPGSERDGLEVRIRIDLGVALVADRGFTADEVAEVYARARAICTRTGDPQQLFDALSGLFLFHQARAELTTARELTRQRLEVAERIGDRGLVTQVHENLGTPAFWRGEFAEGLESIDRALERYDPVRAREIAHVYGTESSVVCETYATQLLWFLGRPEAALERAERAVARAREVGHANSLGLALAFAASFHHLLGDPNATRAYADETVAFCHEQRLRFWIGMGTIFQGVAEIAAGKPEAGIETMTRGMTGHQAAGSRLGGALCLAFLAEGHLALGHYEDAIGVLTGGVAMLGPYEDHFFDAEVERVRGIALCRAGQAEPGDAALRGALEIARSQGSRMLELRAATSRVACLSPGAARDAARVELGRVYASFDEGLAFPDLRLARETLAG
jgi:class 3 adenylate cyclase/predicted ATPase